jgi:gliding motility-associated-like protein
VNVTVNGGTLVQPMVSLLSSTSPCASPFTELACNTSTTNTTTLSYSALTVGTIYYIYVDGTLGNVGTFQLCLTSPAQPVNDDPCNAITLPVNNFCSGPNAYTTVGASGESLTSTFIPTCFDNSTSSVMNSVYFSFTAAGNTAVITINGNLVQPQVAIISPTNGCSGTDFTNSACQTTASGNNVSLTVTNLFVGTTYLIIVDGYQANTGSFEICLNSYQATGTVPNDDCVGATFLCPSNRYFATTNGATPNSIVDPRVANNPPFNNNGEWSTCNGVVDNSIWFTFTTTNPVQPINFTINSNCFDKSGGSGQYPNGGSLQFNVFRRIDGLANCANHGTSNNGTWSTLGCITIGQPSPASGALTIAANLMQPNTQYFIVVDNFPGCACDFDFTVTGNQGAAAGVDQSVCLNAPSFNLTGFTPLSGGTWSGPGITNATLGTFNPTAAGIGSHTLFYTFGACTDIKKITVTAPAVSVSPDVNLCAGQCTTILANATQTQTTVTNPSFSNTTSAPIPDNNTTGLTSNISVSGLSSSTFPSSVCLNITHTWVEDLDIFLRCPDGTLLELSTDNGGSGDNYTNTCFNLTSAVNITSGAAPFNNASGYLPEGGSLSSLNGCNMNGIWSLIVKDDASLISGTLQNWTITFTNSVTTNIPATFTWSPTTDMTNSTTLTPQVCPTATTTSSQTYTLTATDVNGCVATEQVVVSIAPLAITASNDQTICAGATVNLTANGAFTYSWASPNTGDLSGTSGANVSASPTVTTTYTVTGTSGTCTDTEEITVTVGANLIPTLTADTVCANQSLNLTSDIANATSYVWTGPGGFTSSTQNPVISNATAGNSGTYSLTVTSNGCSGTATVNALVNQVPTLNAITSQTVCPFTNTNSISFNGTANATFNWTNSNVATGLSSLTGSGNIPSFVATNTTTATITSQVVVTPTLNGCDGTAQTFTITVSTPGTLTFTMDSVDLTCASPTSGAITITPGGANYTYDWISGPTNYTLPTTSQSNLVNLPEGEYCVEINSPSQSAGNVTIFTETFESGITNWTLNNTNGTNIWVNNNSYIGGYCDPFGSVAAVPNQPVAITGAPNSNYLHIMATSTAPVTCGPASVNFPPLNANFNGSQASTQYATLNTAINTIGLSNVTISFYWLGDGDVNDYAILESSIDGGITWLQAGAILNNQTTWIQTTRTSPTWANISNLRFRFKWINNSSSSQDPPIAIDQIVITADAPATCPAQATQCATLIAPPVTHPTFNQISSICQGGTINLPTSSNNANSISGTWTPPTNNQATTTYTFTPTLGQCAVDTTMEVVVKPTPILSPVTSQSLCAGQTVNGVNYSSSVSGTTVSWSNSSSAIGLASSGSGNLNSFTGVNSGNIPLTGTIIATPTADGCPGSPITFSVTVNPIPALTAVNSQIVCTGQQVNGVTFSSTPTGSTINWTNTESTIGLASSGTGDITSFTGINTGNNTLTGTITATPTANGCNGLPQTFSITVNPIPVLTSISSQTVCAGQTVNGITYSSTVTNTSVNWINTTSAIGISTNGTGNINSFTGTNSGTTPLTGTVTATPSANGCDGLPQTFSVTVNPNPIDITAPPTDETCGLSNGSLEVTNANGGTAPYQFSIDGGANAPAPVTLTNLSAGAYTITVTDANGCVFTKTVTINNIPGPDADFTANQLTGLDSIDVVFTNQSSSGANIDYYWNFGNGILDTTSTLSASPSQEYFGTNSYTVTLIASNGNPSCNDTASIFIFVDISPYIEVPNVFSPNGDGLNEFFSLKYKGYKELNLIIYNRWGNKMYETTNPAVGWDGSGASEGTYFYIVTGKGNDNKDFEAKGYLTLVR